MEAEMCAGRTPRKRPCLRPVAEHLATVPVCPHHYERIVLAVTESRGEAAAFTPGAVVYYIGDPPSQLVKIGTTTRLLQRFAALRAKRPEIRLLAAEPGHFELERARHRQFASDRFSHKGTQREWYHKSEALMEHVNGLRARLGDPWQVNRA